jgi:hypothetical protein
MAARLSQFEEFELRFNQMRAVVNDSPKRLATFYSESKEVSDAVKAFQNFLWETDFERRVFHGPESYSFRRLENSRKFGESTKMRGPEC